VLNGLSAPQKLKESTGQDLEQVLSNPQRLNPYSYANNNLVKYIDPTGEDPLIWDYTTDVMFFNQSLSDYQQNNSFGNAIALVVDAFGVMLPVLPAGAGGLFKGFARGFNYLTDLWKQSRAIKTFQKAIQKGNYIIDSRKLTDYALDTAKEGKAIVFEKYGYTKNNYQDLIDDINSNIDSGTIVERGTTQYGEKFSIDLNFKSRSGGMIELRTGWFLDKGSKQPRLITTYFK